MRLPKSGDWIFMHDIYGMYLQQRGNANHLLLDCGADTARGDQFPYSRKANPNCFLKYNFSKMVAVPKAEISPRTVNMIG